MSHLDSPNVEMARIADQHTVKVPGFRDFPRLTAEQRRKLRQHSKVVRDAAVKKYERRDSP